MYFSENKNPLLRVKIVGRVKALTKTFKKDNIQ